MRPPLIASRRRLLQLAAPAIIASREALAQGGIGPGPGTAHSTGGGGGAFTLVSHAAATGGSPTTTAAISTLTANLIVVASARYSSGPDRLLDSSTNTWTQIGVDMNVGGLTFGAFWCFAPSVSASHTFTLADDANTYIAVAAFSGAVSTPLDQTTFAAAGGAVTTLAAGSITPTLPNELVVAFLGLAGGSTGAPTIGGGFTVTDSAPTGSFRGGGLAYLSQTTAVAANPAWTWAGADDQAGAIIASFK